MTYRVPAILFAVVVSGMAQPAGLGADEKNQPVQVTATAHASLSPGGTIRIEHSYGDLTVEGWDRPDVELTVIKSMPYGFKNDKGEASKHLERVSVALESKSGSEVTVSTKIPTRGGPLMPPPFRAATGKVMLEYVVSVPRDAKLVIRHGEGFVLIADVKGDVDATCGRGDIVLMLRDPGPYAIDARSRLGTVVSDFPRGPQVGSPQSRIHLRAGFGGITIKAVPVEGTGK